MNNSNADLLADEVTGEVIPEPMTQADYDRYAKLHAGILKLQAEEEALRARVVYYAPEGKSTKVYGSVVVKTTERRDKDIAAMTNQYPFDVRPDGYKQVLDPSKFDEKELIFKAPIKVVSVSFAE